MSTFSYKIRNYCRGDLDNLIRLGDEVESLKEPWGCGSVQDLIENLGHPGNFPERNLFVVEAPGHMVGYINVLPELSIGRVVISCMMHPRHREKNLAESVVKCALSRAE